jgi:hypothetical protein
MMNEDEVQNVQKEKEEQPLKIVRDFRQLLMEV